MTARTQAEQLLTQLEYLLQNYSLEMRSTTQPYRLQQVRDGLPNYEYNPDDALVREPLIEHVGSLPVVATAFFPHIDDPDVDLGRALTMLAVHDIGELVTGDVSSFVKGDDTSAEQKAALKLLDPMYHELYRDAEAKGSRTAKFAKAVDKITPDIFDYLTPADVTITRLRAHVGVEADGIVDLIIKHKRPYMLWNPFMTEFHKLLCERLGSKLAGDR